MIQSQRASQPSLQMRHATCDDASNILSFWHAAETVPTLTDTVEDIKTVVGHGSAVCILAISDGQIIGTVIATFDGWRGAIYRLAVDPKHRRHGIARTLVAEAESIFKKWGAKRVTAI